MKLSEMKQILSSGQIQLTKSLGQNFLHDQNQLRRIVASGEILPEDHVLEIGPGLGPLTQEIQEKGCAVLAIEKDQRLYEILQTRFPESSRVTLVHADALDYLRTQKRDWSDWKLVANLPYSVGSPILVELALAERPPKMLVATLQLEVVERLVAQPDREEYGLLSLLIQLVYEPKGWFKIPAGCFYPPPQVDSGCVTLVRRKAELLPANQRSTFTKIVKRGFSQRRKMMIKLLKADWPLATLHEVFRKLDLPPEIRAEKVTLDQFVRLAQELHGART